MRRQAHVILLLVGCLLLVATRSAWSQPAPMTFAELVSEANLIVRGYVADQRAEWISGEDGTAIVTVVIFRIERTLKGDASIQIPLEFLGGTIGDTRVEVSHVPTFEIGDRAVLFLDTTTPLISPVIGGDLGLFPITVSPNGSGDVVVSHNGVSFASVAQLGVPRSEEAPGVSPLSLVRFESEIISAGQEIR